MKSGFYIFLGVLGSLLVAALAAWLQQRNWVHQNFEKRREDQKSTAHQLALDIAYLLDKRLYRQRRFMWALRSGHAAEIEKTKNEYAESVGEWNESFGRFKAALWSSFGDNARMEFEREVHQRYVEIGRVLEGVYSGRLSKSELAECDDRLNALQHWSAAFVYRRLLNVRRDQVGDIPEFSKVSQENWRRLTSTFLIRRLFGLTEQR